MTICNLFKYAIRGFDFVDYFSDWDYAFINKTRKVIQMKEDIIKSRTQEVGKELYKNVSIHFSLEGWPCTVAFIGLSFAYVMTTKIKCEKDN